VNDVSIEDRWGKGRSVPFLGEQYSHPDYLTRNLKTLTVWLLPVFSIAPLNFEMDRFDPLRYVLVRYAYRSRG
jgi:hypothetical protein